jgi:S-adenosylmethionine-diacylgycerolhomoserine-N-methlytransferase
VVEADATTYRPPHLADQIYFSYSLTMIPDWERALANALGFLRVGGTLGVVDFQVPSTSEGTSLGRWLEQTFWPWWFAHDGVRLSREHLPYLATHLRPHYVREGCAAIPYLSGLQVPYYVFVGSKV